MKKKFLLFAAVAGLSVVTLSSYHNGAANNGYDCTGAEGAGTGTYVNPVGCSTGGGCHATSLTSTVGVTITLDSAGVPTTHYKGGHTYTIKISGTNGTGLSLPKYGFQISALKDSVSRTTNSDAGTFATTGLPTSTRISPPSTAGTQLTVAEQSTGIVYTGTTIVDSFSWTAPATGTGTISLWGVVNFINNNGSADAGDKWNTTSLIIHEWPWSASVSSVANNIAVNVYPNPVMNELNIELGNTTTGTYQITVSDLTGKTVATQTVAIANNNQTVSLNTNTWKSGMYFVNISGNGASKVVRVVKN